MDQIDMTAMDVIEGRKVTDERNKEVYNFSKSAWIRESLKQCLKNK